MRVSRIFILLLGLLVLVVSLPVSAVHWFQRVCFSDLFIPEIPVIVVGCEVIDCCPGCPASAPIDWRIRFEGDPIDRVLLTFNDGFPQKPQTLKVRGNAKWSKNGRLEVSRGESFIQGFDRIGRARAPVIQVTLEPNQSMITAALDSKDLPDVAGDFKFSIEQIIGGVVVNEYKLDYHLLWCRRTPECLRLPIAQDRIDLNNNDANDNAIVLLDGRRSAGCQNDEIWRGNDIINVANLLSSGGCNNEFAVFSDDDAMQLIQNSGWSDALGDLVPTDMTPNRLQDTVTVWLNAAGTQPRAQAEMLVADLLYNLNNSGVGFLTNVNYQVIPLAIVANVTNTITNVWNTLTCIGLPPAVFNAGQLNLYYVNSAFTGWWCPGSNVIGIGTNAQPESLSHEIGHAYSLGHTNGLAGFANNNIMWGGGVGRTTFTVGQSFRINVNTNSTLNTNGTRTGATRTCPDGGPLSATCPALSVDAAAPQ